jgi:hypothetical protein
VQLPQGTFSNAIVTNISPANSSMAAAAAPLFVACKEHSLQLLMHTTLGSLHAAAAAAAAVVRPARCLIGEWVRRLSVQASLLQQKNLSSGLQLSY